MTGKQLKNSILQLAIQGKLVPQDPHDEPASVLLQQIRREKELLAKEGKLKKKDLVSAPIEDEEKAFEIPESWEWCRLGDICSISLGFTYKPKYDESGIKFLSVKDISSGKIKLDNTKYVSQEIYDNAPSGAKPRKGDILFGRVGTLGKPSIVEFDEPFCIFVSLGFLRCYYEDLSKEYLCHWMYSKFFYDQIEKNVKGTAQVNLNTSWLKDFYIPLPPLAEQHRIVAKIEELMPLVEEYDKAQTQLDKLNAALPDALKKSILQEAIQGKLVPQDPNDEPASVLLEKIRKEKEQLVKEGKLKKKDLISTPIADEDKPFEIPESWEWVSIGEIFLHASGKQQSSSNRGNGTLRKYITTSNLYWNRFDLDVVKEMPFTDEEIKTCSATKGDLLVCEGGAGYGRSAIWPFDYDICLQNHVHRLRPIVNGICEYVYHFIYLLKETNQLQSVGTAMPGLSANRLKGLVLPLPPLAEQHRIVAKLEELLPKLDNFRQVLEKSKS